jgi:Amiloride-sensitive sodium channel
MMYTEIEQVELMSISAFISNLGGAAGLCAGMSVVTIMQAIAFYIQHKCSKSSQIEPDTKEAPKTVLGGYLNRLDCVMNILLCKH